MPKHRDHTLILVEKWHNYVQQTLQDLYEDAAERFHHRCVEKTNTRPILAVPSRTRTCEVSLKHILRPDLPSDHKEIFLERLEANAVKMTDLQSVLSSIIHAMMIRCTSRGFSVSTSKVQLQTATETQHLDIARLLPDHIIRNKQFLIKDRFIPVSSLPDLKDVPKDSTFWRLFSQGHVQNILATHITSAAKSKNVPQGSTAHITASSTLVD